MTLYFLAPNTGFSSNKIKEDKNMKTSIRCFVFGVVALLVSAVVPPSAVLAKDQINTTFFGNKAIKGYDPVAYFTDGKPVEGKKELELQPGNSSEVVGRRARVHSKSGHELAGGSQIARPSVSGSIGHA